MRPVSVAIASFAAMPAQFTDDGRIIAALAARGVPAESVPWDDLGADWEVFDAVVIRSTWDYARRRGEFLEWADRIGDRLHNSPALVRWNSDKRYLGELAGGGHRVVETIYVEPGNPVPDFDGEVVVKPSVSAGGRDTGRFGPAAHDTALALIEAIPASGRAAMVQAYQPAVDTIGETAVLCIDGEPAHTLRKLAVLRPDEVAPTRDDAVGAAEVMYDPGLVTPAAATEAELGYARGLVAAVADRFDYMPLYARVDLIPGADGEPTLMELEAIEPNFYLDQVPATTDVVAEAIIRRL
jgi:glutathione synthase/RimK-type ligase-like ATP-grasp enzyme